MCSLQTYAISKQTFGEHEMLSLRITLDIIFSKVSPNPTRNASFKNPVQTGASYETEERFPGKILVQTYSMSLAQVLYVTGGCRPGDLSNSTQDSMALRPPAEDNFVSISSGIGVLRWAVSLEPLSLLPNVYFNSTQAAI